VSLKAKHRLDLKRVIDVISTFQGVVGVFLFGSFARGDFDEYSDYDLLVLFDDKFSMWRSWDELFQSVANLRMDLHVIPETLEEFETASPVFLEELLEHGKVLFARLPLEVFLRPVNLKLFCLIFYDMTGLSYKDKMKASYFLYRKRNGGAVAKAGGTRLGEGCISVPNNMGDEIINTLSDFGVKTRKLEMYASKEYLKALS
jgi:predicted nucleotidyltransferase